MSTIIIPLTTTFKFGNLLPDHQHDQIRYREGASFACFVSKETPPLLALDKYSLGPHNVLYPWHSLLFSIATFNEKHHTISPQLQLHFPP